MTITLANPSASGSDGRGERAEHREQDHQDDREAGALGGLEVLLGEVLHAGPERLLADEVELNLPRRPVREPELVAHVGGGVGGLVAVAVET